MTEAELLQAIRDARRPGIEDEGVTVTELVAGLGWSVDAVRACLRAGLAQGRYRLGRKRIQDMSGRWTSVPSYVLKE